jgi:glycosyltransferase involved in cell wall biosynthesis
MSDTLEQPGAQTTGASSRRVDEEGITILDPHITPIVKPAPAPKPEEKVAVHIPRPDDVTIIHNEERLLRVLFITFEEAYRDESLAAEKYRSYGSHFNEVHVIVVTEGDTGMDSIELAPNVWVYPTNSSKWWQYPVDVYNIVSKQLVFAHLLRIDIISASDPFELGCMAWMVSKRWKCPFVLEGSERLSDAAFFDESEDNGFRGWMARFVMPRALSVRARSTYARSLIATQSGVPEDRIDVVPRHADHTMLEHTHTSTLLKELYPQFNFYVVTIAPLRPESGLDLAINAASHSLHQYPTMCLIVLGDGPYKKTLEALVKEKALTNVFFEPMPPDVLPYLTSASMAIVPKLTSVSEEVLLSAAAVGLPTLVSRDSLIEDVFEDGESAVVCNQGDLGCAIKAISLYLNDTALRVRYGHEARDRAHAMISREGISSGALLYASLEKALFMFYDTEDQAYAAQIMEESAQTEAAGSVASAAVESGTVMQSSTESKDSSSVVSV